MSRKIFFSLAAVLSLHGVSAQTPVLADYLKEINRDIWTPFSEAYATGNAEQYIGLHSGEFIRVEGNGRRVLNLAQYAEGVRKSFQYHIDNGDKTGLNFRFTERIANHEAASERGIFELVVKEAGGESRRFYGKFHVISRKEDGVWKILVDYDSNEGGTINEKTYQEAKGVEDFSYR